MSKKPKRKYYKPVESTQQNIPIDDFVDGLVVDTEGNYSKIIEVKPQPFFLKKNKDQNKISDLFKQLLKVAPDELHFKTMSVPSNMTSQISKVNEAISYETDESRKNMGLEYLGRLKEAQEYGVNRRFFVSFPYKNKNVGLNKKSLNEIEYEISSDTRTLVNMLEACGNEAVVHEEGNENYELGNLFYQIYNRDSSIDHPFDEHYQEVYDKYRRLSGKDDFFVPTKDLIAPIRMSYEDNKYLVVNETYYDFLYITADGYNKYVCTGWLNRFINSFVGVDVDIFLKKIEKEQVNFSLKRAIGHARADLNDNIDTSDSFENSLGTLSAAKYLKDGLSQGEDFFYVSTIITVSGKSPKEVAFKVEELKKSAKQVDIILKENKYRNEESFNVVLPSSSWNDSLYTFKKSKRNVLTDGAASFYPFTTFQMVDDNGLYIADDFSGSPVILDLFNRKRFSAPHCFISGITGSGKTCALTALALRASITRYNDMPTSVFIIAPEKEDEYRRVCEAIGGQFLSFGSGSSQRINIFEIMKKDERAIENANLLNGSSFSMSSSLLSEKISTLMEFFQLHIDKLDNEEKQLLNEAIISVYEQYGITKDNDSLWADRNHTRYKKMPTMSSLVKELEKTKETLKLARNIKLLTTGAGEFFDGETNINVNNNFFVIGLEHNSKDMLPLAIYVALDYCYSKCKENNLQRKYLICDEFWKMCFNSVACERFMELSKLLRSHNTALILSCQNLVSDVLAIENGKYGLAILNNMPTKILLNMKENDAATVADMLDLDTSEEEMLGKFSAGQGLLIAGENRMKLQFMLSETEKLLTFTDAKTLEKYIEQKQRAQFEKESFIDFSCFEATNRKEIYI